MLVKFYVSSISFSTVSKYFVYYTVILLDSRLCGNDSFIWLLALRRVLSLFWVGFCGFLCALFAFVVCFSGAQADCRARLNDAVGQVAHPTFVGFAPRNDTFFFGNDTLFWIALFFFSQWHTLLFFIVHW